MAASIVTDDTERCFICGRPHPHEHHIFGGPLRQKSERYGLKVPLCYRCHNDMSNKQAVHFNAEMSRWLKQIGQKAFEEIYGHEFFMETFGRNYL